MTTTLPRKPIPERVKKATAAAKRAAKKAAQPTPEARAADAPADRIELGNNADRLLHDPVLALAFELCERDLMDVWRRTGGNDSDAREAAYWGIRGLTAARTKLHKMLGDKKAIEAEAERKRKADEYAADHASRGLRVV